MRVPHSNCITTQRVDPLPEADRISFIYQLMVSGTRFNAAQTRSARCLAEYRHPGARQICSSDLSQCRLAANRCSQLFRETVFGWDPDVGKRLINDILREDRKSTRLNSSHITISYAVFCLKKKKK